MTAPLSGGRASFGKATHRSTALGTSPLTLPLRRAPVAALCSTVLVLRIKRKPPGRHLILTRIYPCSFSTDGKDKCMLKSRGSSFAGAGPVFCDTAVTEHLFCRSVNRRQVSICSHYRYCPPAVFASLLWPWSDQNAGIKPRLLPHSDPLSPCLMRPETLLVKKHRGGADSPCLRIVTNEQRRRTFNSL